MPGCQCCQNGYLCAEGFRLKNELALAELAVKPEGIGCGRWGDYFMARDLWLVHLHGCWWDAEDEPALLSKNERALLRAFVNRRRPDIPARRAGMHQR